MILAVPRVNGNGMQIALIDHADAGHITRNETCTQKRSRRPIRNVGSREVEGQIRIPKNPFRKAKCLIADRVRLTELGPGQIEEPYGKSAEKQQRLHGIPGSARYSRCKCATISEEGVEER